jgi:beta-lactam-binding protein with PASTA domain/tRNA A-37 threonylcarbamoyl transferase component Bud32
VERPTETAPDLLVGRLLDGRYRLDSPIARGGMATVYTATDTRLDRTVAVKVMRPALAEDPDFVARFAREARAAARLHSPEVVAVHDQGTDAETGTAYLVMEYVEGRTLRDVIRDRGALPPARALTLLEPVLRALAAAHGAGIVHRDVKPENVLLGDDGRIKVADFGLARAVETSNLTATTGLLIGTVAYLAPEQVEHGTADTRTDVYAAGILLWEMLTGTPPYDADSPLSVAYRHVHDDVPPPSQVVAGIPPAVDALVLRATRRDPAARPVDAGAFLAELEAVRADLPATADTTVVRRQPAHHTQVLERPARLPVVAAPAGPPRRRRTGLIAAVVVALLAVLALAGGWYLGTGRYTSAPSVLTLTEKAARAKLTTAGLKWKPGAQVFDEQIPLGAVARQDPVPNGRVRKGGTVTYVLSKGPDRRAVPKLIGSTQDIATQALKSVGLAVGTVTSEYNQAQAGTVIRTSPASGQKLRPGATVTLVVSKGVEMLPIPDVRTKQQGDAVGILRNAGFAATVEMVFSDTVPSGVVIDQSPNSGQAARGSTVALRVSKGPELIAVPDVTQQPQDAAVAQLESLGLKTRVISIPGPGIVRQQSPGAGTKVRKGTTVTLYVF